MTGTTHDSMPTATGPVPTAMDAAQQDLLAASTRHLLDTTAPDHVVASLRELGWFELRVADRQAAEGTFFEMQGETLATSSVLDVVLGETLGLKPGEDGTAVLHPLPGPPDRPGATGRISPVDGLLTYPGRIERVVIPAGANGPVNLSGRELSDLRLTPFSGMDPDSGWRRLQGSLPRGHVPGPDPSPAQAATVHRALAHELIGVTRAMLALAVAHAIDRQQFGRPIGSFQAIQTRLADVRVALEVAEQAVGAAWESTDGMRATMAKILAGNAARLATRHCQQVLGGIGFTWEHPLHRYVRRALSLDALGGSAAHLTVTVGAALAAEGSAPGLVQI